MFVDAAPAFPQAVEAVLVKVPPFTVTPTSSVHVIA